LGRLCSESLCQSCLLVLSFFKAKRSQYYGKFEANFSIYTGQMSFHIRYIRLYIILILLWTFSKLFARFSFLFLKFISVNSSAFVSEDLNFKSLHFSRNFKLFLVAFSISLPIFDPDMSFSVNYIDKNNRLISLNTSHWHCRLCRGLCTRCTQSLSSLMTIRPLWMINQFTEPVYCCLQLDWGHSDD
jgi:hypothetical protein